MKRCVVLIAATPLAILLAVTAVRAQAFYLTPEPARPAPGEEIRVRLVSGVPFAGQELPLADLQGMELQRLWNGGRVDLKPEAGTAEATFRANEAGTQLIAYLPRGAGGSVTSFGKALLVVGEPEPGERIWRSELGQRLEIVPETDPVALARHGGRLEIQVLFDREPLAGATVAAVAEGAAAESFRQGLTDALGRVGFDLDRPGRWIVHLAHKSFKPGGERGWALFQNSLLLAAGP